MPDATQTKWNIDHARAGDAWFLLKQVIIGAATGNFSPIYLLKTEQVKLLKRCCYAMLRRTWRGLLGRNPALIFSPGHNFLAVRYAGKTVGAALIIMDRREDAASTYIDTVAVDQCWQRRGIGCALLQLVIQHAPQDCDIYCACAPESRGMMHLLKRHDFRITQPFKKSQGIVQPKMFVYRKGRQRTATLKKTTRRLPRLPSLQQSPSVTSRRASIRQADTIT